jgi:hypothetical protein
MSCSRDPKTGEYVTTKKYEGWTKVAGVSAQFYDWQPSACNTVHIRASAMGYAWCIPSKGMCLFLSFGKKDNPNLEKTQFAFSRGTWLK